MKFSLKKLRQPFRCMGYCTIAGIIIGILSFIIGIPLLVYFGSELKSEELKQKIPAWIGLILLIIGIVCLVAGISICCFLIRLFQRQTKSSYQQAAHFERSAANAGSSPYPTQYSPPTPTAPQVIDKIEPHEQTF